MLAGAITCIWVHKATAATGSGSSGFTAFIWDHTQQFDACCKPGPAISCLAIWTSTQCHNAEPAPAARMKETSVLGRCPERLVAICTTLSLRQEHHFPVSWIFLQFFCKHCQCPLNSSLLSLDTVYHPVGDPLLQRHILKVVWIPVWSSEN